MQGLHGREPVLVSGAHHLLVRHGLSEVGEATRFRHFLQVLNDLSIVAYSRKNQTVRIVAPLPVTEARAEPPTRLRIVERDRPYSNVRHLRETLRACKDYIWWADPHFSKKGFEPLTDEADATRIKQIRILSGPAQADDAKGDFRRFRDEMAAAGISVEWRVVETRDRDWHDRFIVTKGTAWNVPPVNSLYKGDYSEIAETQPPPFNEWWEKGAPIAP